MSECPYCGDTLHSFSEELEDGTLVYVIVCPTCYRFHSSYLKDPWLYENCSSIGVSVTVSEGTGLPV